MVVLISDDQGGPVYNGMFNVAANSTILAASFGTLGSVLQEPPPIGSLTLAPLPAGTYTLSVFMEPPPLIDDYANDTPFTYAP
jgi:hypothetical protein